MTVILVDTSIWIDHFRLADPFLTGLLEEGDVISHPFVIGELALGHLQQRQTILDTLADLPQATVAEDGDVLDFIGRHKLNGTGIGYVDVHLLAAARLTHGAKLWTRDRRLVGAAVGLGIAQSFGTLQS